MGKKRRHRERERNEGTLQAIKRSNVFQFYFVGKRNIIRQTDKLLNW